MKKHLCIALCGLLLACTFPAMAENISYPDVPDHEWFYGYVVELSEQGVVNGYPDGKFYPNENVLWDQALKLILLAAGYSEQPATAESWAGGYLALAQSQGFLSAGGGYELSLPISRLEVAQLAARALGIFTTLTEAESPFADCSDPEVLALYEIDVLTGQWADGQLIYAGDLPLRRSEVSAIVWRIYQYVLRRLEEESQPPELTDPNLPVNPDLGLPPVNPEGNETPGPDVPAFAPATITYNDYIVEVMPEVPVFAYDPAQFAMENGRMTCSDPNVRLVHGIDVSSYQGLVDWNRVRNDGIDFAILRMGYRGYTVGALNKDTTFDFNAKHAREAGLDVGVYVFSQAITVEEALEEADFVLEAIRGYDINGPVVFDWEVIGKKEARTYGLETDILTDAANAFCRRIAEAGYSPMIYFNSYAGYVKYDLSQLLEYPFWFAQYTQQPSFYYNFHMWQYSSSGRVDGIEGNVDMDVWLLNYGN